MIKIKKWSERTRKSRIIIVVGLFLTVSLIVSGAVVINKASRIFRDRVPIEQRENPGDGDNHLGSLPSAENPSDLDIDYTVSVDETGRDPIYRTDPIDQQVINVLVVGYDARPGYDTGNSDVLMLVSYNRANRTVKLVSLMRDLWVPIERHGSNRINAAFPLGGIGLAINTVNDLFDLDVQHYVTIRFESFVELVDYLGTIPLELSRSEVQYINRHYRKTQLPLKSGCHNLNGSQMLAHVRNRSVGNADFDRTRRQRAALLAIFEYLQKHNDPLLLYRLINVSFDQIRTNLDPGLAYVLAREIIQSRSLNVTEGRVPDEGSWYYADENGRSVIVMDQAKNKEYLHSLLYD